MKALRRFTVRVSLPDELSALSELVMNLRWSWHAPTRDIFESIDPQRWQDSGNDPLRLLGEVSSERLTQLAKDERFKLKLEYAAAELRQYLDDKGWYATAAEKALTEGDRLPSQIAYFSPEFGITEVLPQYSGGLGILAGDHLKAASDLGVPILGVGLLYGAGYFSQSLSADGWQKESYPSYDPEGMPLIRLRDAEGAPLTVSIGMPAGHVLHAQIWQAKVGRVTLLLLDSDVESNAPSERSVTDRLYGGGKDHRLAQEILLGVGGVRAIRAYCEATGAPEPEVFHTNEGHAGFLGIERIRELMGAEGGGLSFDEALQAVRAGTVFTTHTPVPAGIDRFDKTLVSAYLSDGAALPGLPVDRVLALGNEDDSSIFNMAHMGLRLSQHRNGVSKLHGEVSRGMFNGLWAGFDQGEVPISSVTNGVHAPTWVSPAILELAERESGTTLPSFELADSVANKTIWSLRNQLRGELVQEIRRRVYNSSLQRGGMPAELGWTEQIFDPKVLTIGFARRVPSYKRLTLMLRDPDRMREMLLDPQRPVQIVIAGKSHPADDGGKELIQQMVRFADDPEVRHRIAFLPDYDIEMARSLYAGCDVWLNNPLRPLEACGTSGMKAALNGGLNLSIRDGWWDEMYDGQNGWAIPTADGVEDVDRRDDIEAAGFYELLEGEVAKRFYDVDSDGVPRRWVEMVRHTLSTLGPKVLATRMVNDYVRQLYAPAAASSAALSAEAFAGARSLSTWISKVQHAWSGVRVAFVESTSTDDAPALGTQFDLRAEVWLPGLSPQDVVVQAVFGRPDDDNELHDVTHVDMEMTDADGDRYVFSAGTKLDRPGPLGYTVRVLPRNDALSTPVELGLVSTA